MRCTRGASLFEFAVVVAVVAVLMAVLLQRLTGTAAAAREVQLRMAAEQLRLQAELLQLRCGPGFDTACWQRQLAQRRAPRGEPVRPDADAPSFTPDAPGLLQAAAQAAGLMALRDVVSPDWQLQRLPEARLQVALRSHPGCRFVVERSAGDGRVVVNELLSTDC